MLFSVHRTENKVEISDEGTVAFAFPLICVLDLGLGLVMTGFGLALCGLGLGLTLCGLGFVSSWPR